MLKRLIELESGISIRPNDWRYHGEMRATVDQGGIVEDILRSIKSIGFAITRMPPIPTLFYVFDLQLAVGDLRIYSSDPELIAFRKRRKQGEMGKNGHLWVGEQEVLKGEVEIDSKETAMRMGITDYKVLLAQEFYVSIIRESSESEYLERSILPELREKMRPFGVDIMNLRIRVERVSKTRESIATQEHGQAPLLKYEDESGKMEARERLRLGLIELESQTDPRARGYSLEKFLNELFALEGLQPRRSFKVTGEQIDGSFVWRHRTHLLEAKWTQQPTAGSDFGAFIFKIEGKTADTRGLFVSINGYSADGVTALKRKGELRFVCLDGAHLAHAVKPEGSLTAVLEEVWRHADETGEPYVPGSELRFC